MTDSSKILLHDFGMGELLDTTSNHPIIFQPSEISHYHISILSPAGMTNGKVLSLETPGGNVFLKVIGAAACGEGETLWRYKLAALDKDVSLEEIFKRYRSLKGSQTSTAKDLIRFVRFDTTPAIVVHAKTFGAIGFYQLDTLNASKSGMLLNAAARKQVPFGPNTLLEIRMVPRGKWLYQPIHCLAKVIRCYDFTDNKDRNFKNFGIKLLEFSNELARENWERALVMLEAGLIKTEMDIGDFIFDSVG